MRKRQVSPNQLHSIQAQQQENGLLGERYVYDYEIIRTKRDSGIEWVANYDTAAGFDIMSFETETSTLHDRFIEVKAFSGKTPYFYWSINEMNVAKTKGGRYFLYLVNLDEVNNPKYSPIIIKNPVIEVLNNNEWNKTVDKYYIAHMDHKKK